MFQIFTIPHKILHNLDLFILLSLQWEVGAKVLEILCKLMVAHEVDAEDFSDQTVELQSGGTVVANKRPGHTLLIHMLNDSAMLRMVNITILRFT